MNRSESLIHCPNSACSNPLNPLGHKFCENCQTPLQYRYLWAASPVGAQIPPGTLVEDRYQVVAPQIWLDTRPDITPHVPEQLPDAIVPYLRLYPQRLHIPEVYGYALLNEKSTLAEILLLENVPVDASGKLIPSILEAWHQASAVRQVYWLWQILQLWKPLAEQGVVSSLFVAENLRVEGWRVRLRQLYTDVLGDNGNGVSPEAAMYSRGVEVPGTALFQSPDKLSLQPLGAVWASWFREAQAPVNNQLQEIYQQMQAEDASVSAIARSLNQLLIEQAAQLPLHLRVAGATDPGPMHQHNEDSCYPTASDLPADVTEPIDPLITHLSIVCDGIGGHEGGEVASQLAVLSLKLQVKAILSEVAADHQIITPDIVEEQLAAIIRVANNLIAARNDQQGRESRRRMGTTLMMALQLPQQVETPNGTGNSHELYIANVGDSRAYWITPHYCQQLAVDDDVATREVRMGRSLYRQALELPEASALTQAMGTRDSEFLRPNIQRLILEEDGLLLLCSDGLSDNNLVEQSWRDYAEPILTGQMSVESAVESLIELANQKNGHDNTSVVLTYCRVSFEHPVLLNLGEIGSTNTNIVHTPSMSSELAPASLPLLDAEPVAAEETKPAAAPNQLWLKGLVRALGLLALLIGGGAVGLTAWSVLNPNGFQRFRDRLPKLEQPPFPPVTPQSSSLPR